MRVLFALAILSFSTSALAWGYLDYQASSEECRRAIRTYDQKTPSVERVELELKNLRNLEKSYEEIMDSTNGETIQLYSVETLNKLKNLIDRYMPMEHKRLNKMRDGIDWANGNTRFYSAKCRESERDMRFFKEALNRVNAAVDKYNIARKLYLEMDAKWNRYLDYRNRYLKNHNLLEQDKEELELLKILDEVLDAKLHPGSDLNSPC